MKSQYFYYSLHTNQKLNRTEKDQVFDTMLMPIPHFQNAYRLEPTNSNCYPKNLIWHKNLENNAQKKHKKAIELIENGFDDPDFEDRIKAIIGKDERRRVTGSEIKSLPYSSVGRINVVMPSGDRYTGTGTYIGNNKVLTAAHVVFDTKTNQQAAYVSFTPQKDGKKEPFGSFRASQILVSKKYIDLPDYNVVWDWAIIKIEGLTGKICPIPLTGSKQPEAQTSGKDLMEIPGYPGDKGGDKMYTSKNTYLSMNYWRIMTWVDVTAGQSGGPILLQNFEMTYNQIVGVLSGDIYGPNGPINLATRLNDKDLLEIWKF